MPIADKPRQFTWRKTRIQMNYDGSSKIADEISTSNRIDLRESVFNFLPQEVYTKDTVLLDVNAIMFYSIYNVKKAIYEVEDLQGALSNTAQTQLKEVFGNMVFSDCLSGQSRINDHLRGEFAKLFHDWGIYVHRMELLDLAPQLNTREQMKKQMIAERVRRGDFIRSEGKKAAMRLEAEGNRVVSVTMGLAEQEATRKISEGESTARVELIRAESLALDTVQAALAGGGASQTDYMIGQKYINLLSSLTKNAGEKTLYLPWNLKACQGSVERLSATFGADAERHKLPGASQLARDLSANSASVSADSSTAAIGSAAASSTKQKKKKANDDDDGDVDDKPSKKKNDFDDLN